MDRLKNIQFANKKKYLNIKLQNMKYFMTSVQSTYLFYEQPKWNHFGVSDAGLHVSAWRWPYKQVLNQIGRQGRNITDATFTENERHSFSHSFSHPSLFKSIQLINALTPFSANLFLISYFFNIDQYPSHKLF